ncbi:MAG: hypothetical protein V5A43_01660 [Haloarculaceae archaeon]
MTVLRRFDEPAWWTALATAVSYAVVLLVFTVVLFGLPYLIFVSL